MASEQRGGEPTNWTLPDGRRVSLRRAQTMLREDVERAERAYGEALGELARFYRATGQAELAALCAAQLEVFAANLAGAADRRRHLQAILGDIRRRLAAVNRFFESLMPTSAGNDAADATPRGALPRNPVWYQATTAIDHRPRTDARPHRTTHQAKMGDPGSGQEYLPLMSQGR